MQPLSLLIDRNLDAGILVDPGADLREEAPYIAASSAS